MKTNGLIEIAITTSSHRQSNRLPEGRIKGGLSGVPLTLGSKTRVWFYPASMRDELERMGYKVHQKETRRRNEHLAYMSSIMSPALSSVPAPVVRG